LNNLKQFIIPFGGLREGKHVYEFEIRDLFFDQFDYSEIEKSDVNVKLTLYKESAMLILEFSLQGTITVMCDRCSDFFAIPIKGQYQLIVKFGEEKYEKTDEIIVIPYTDSALDVTHYIYEYINLLLPQSRVHPKGQCNPKVIQKLEELASTKKFGNTVDPRWEALKDLAVKNQQSPPSTRG